MSENNTKETNESRSFEERVFLRFDAMDSRFDAMDSRFDAMDSRFNAVESRLDTMDGRLTSLDSRVEKLEMKQYDTKPIWEKALAAIAETNTRMERGFEQVKSEFVTLRNDMEHSLHGVERKIDALNQNILQVQADQRYADRRLQELETQTKPT